MLSYSTCICLSYSEVEVRKFFDSATTSNIVEDPQDLIYLHTPSSKPSQPSTTGRKRISQVQYMFHSSTACIYRVSITIIASSVVPGHL